jgi:CHASE2 domain-containing sensor protein
VSGARPRTTRIAWLRPPADGSDTFFEVDASELLAPAEAAAPLLAGLAGKLVLVGVDLVDADRHLTPMAVLNEERMAGVRIHAQIAAQLVDGRWLRDLHGYEELLLLFAIGLTGFAAARRYGLGKFKKALAWVGTVVLLTTGALAFTLAGLLLPYTTALTMWVAAIVLGDRVAPFYDRMARILNVMSARGGLRWDTLYRLGAVFGGRYWRGRL